MNLFMDSDGPHETNSGRLTKDELESIGAISAAAYTALMYVTQPEVWTGYAAYCERSIPNAPRLNKTTREWLRHNARLLSDMAALAMVRTGNNG